jgi:hypothetical protein
LLGQTIVWRKKNKIKSETSSFEPYYWVKKRRVLLRASFMYDLGLKKNERLFSVPSAPSSRGRVFGLRNHLNLFNLLYNYLWVMSLTLCCEQKL